MTTKRRAQLVIINLLIIAMCIVSLYPFWIMVSGSFKTNAQLAANPAGFPHDPTFANYIGLVQYNGNIMVRTFFNDVFISAIYTALCLFVAAMAAFAFAKYRFKGRDLIFGFLLVTIMIPVELGIPPLYILFSRIHWLNTYIVQIIPGIANVFAMFMLRQYMSTIPSALLDSGRIDGAGHWRLFTSIMIPTSRPAIGALAILLFLAKWGDYLWPSVMVEDPKKLPIMVLLPTLNTSDTVWMVPWNLILAGTVIVTVPLIVFFLLFQEQFISSVTIGAVKE